MDAAFTHTIRFKALCNTLCIAPAPPGRTAGVHLRLRPSRALGGQRSAPRVSCEDDMLPTACGGAGRQLPGQRALRLRSPPAGGRAGGHPSHFCLVCSHAALLPPQLPLPPQGIQSQCLRLLACLMMVPPLPSAPPAGMGGGGLGWPDLQQQVQQWMPQAQPPAVPGELCKRALHAPPHTACLERDCPLCWLSCSTPAAGVVAECLALAPTGMPNGPLPLCPACRHGRGLWLA